MVNNFKMNILNGVFFPNYGRCSMMLGVLGYLIYIIPVSEKRYQMINIPSDSTVTNGTIVLLCYCDGYITEVWPC